MNTGQLLSGGAVAALTAALALAALPAQAAPEDLGRNWDRGSSARDNAREAAQERREQRAADQRQARQDRAVPQRPISQPRTPPAPVAQDRRAGGDDRGGGRSEGGRRDRENDGRDWNRSGNGRDWARGGSRGDERHQRNPRYADNERNRSYDGRNARHDDRRAYERGYRNGQRDYRRWDRRAWRSDGRYDWYRHRAANRGTFRLGAYYAPYRNYRYRPISIGFFIDSLFFSNRYRINDPWRYRLPDVYGPYTWVRYYDDALLVDVYNGEVVDVIHDFFW